MAKNKAVININEGMHFPKGFTISDNRVEDFLQRFLKPSEYGVWRQYLRYWGSNKKMAYPSLSTISTATGLSEKTIRAANKQLIKKGYLRYRRGCSNRSNQYYYIEIEKLMAQYYGTKQPSNVGDTIEPIIEYSENATRNFDKRFERLSNESKIVYSTFINYYLEKMGIRYTPSKGDLKALEELKVENKSQSLQIIKTFFTCRNKYIENSDYTFFFFTRPKTQQLCASDLGKTDIGRWTAQANSYFELVKCCPKDLDVDDMAIWIKDKINNKLSGSNTARDNFIVECIIQKLKGVE